MSEKDCMDMTPSQTVTNAIQVGCYAIRRLDTVRVIEFDGKHHIRFSPTEYKVAIALFIDHPVSDSELALMVFNTTNQDPWIQETLEKHIVNIRRKLKKGHISLRILRISSFGYITVPGDYTKM
jgi:DNA-binding response OmpR family regulator